MVVRFTPVSRMVARIEIPSTKMVKDDQRLVQVDPHVTQQTGRTVGERLAAGLAVVSARCRPGPSQTCGLPSGRSGKTWPEPLNRQHTMTLLCVSGQGQSMPIVRIFLSGVGSGPCGIIS